MPERPNRSVRSTIERAIRLAEGEGADTVEAQHLLLALTHPTGSRTARALASLGLSEEVIRAALDREYADALEVVGVGAFARPRSRPRPGRKHPRLGRSAKLALGRTAQAVRDSSDRRLDEHHILLAISRAEAGVIPRALQELGVSPADIEAAIR